MVVIYISSQSTVVKTRAASGPIDHGFEKLAIIQQSQQLRRVTLEAGDDILHLQKCGSERLQPNEHLDDDGE